MYKLDVLEQQHDGAWVATESEVDVERRALLQVVRHSYGQRQAERSTNPHAEHAEEVFTLLEPVPEWVHEEHV